MAVRSLKRRYWLRFEATQNEPDFMGIFMEGGGAINAAATRWHTDFALTGSEASVHSPLLRHELREVRIPIPESEIILPESEEDPDDLRVHLRSEMRLNVATSRIGAAINGTLVSSVSGQGSEHLKKLLDPMKGGGGHAQIGLVYAAWMAHAANVGMSNMRVVCADDGGAEQSCAVRFVRRSEETRQLRASAGQWLERYAQKAWAVRQVLVYPPAPTLTKAVFKEQVGINGRGYSLLHDALVRKAPLSLAALESLYKAALDSTFGGESVETKKGFDTRTEQPGLVAAKQAKRVATATSIAVSHMVAYRADGRNFVSARGADFAPAESWLHQPQRSPIEANDCDGSALLAVGMLRAVREADPEELSQYPTLCSVRNAVHPYYQVGIAVVGATSAEASSVPTGDGVEEKHDAAVAGHAIAVMVPTLGMLRSLAKATGKKLGRSEQLIMSEESAAAVEEARFGAFFPEPVIATLQSEDRALLQEGWEKARDAEENITTALCVLGIEGTTPAHATLYQPDPQLRAKDEHDARNDDKAFAKVAPNVFRSVKQMHVLGGSSGSTHRFYRDIVEVTFARDFPLYTDKSVRNLSAAATQYVFARETPGDAVRVAGASPRDLHKNEYILVPLIQLNAAVATELDEASEEAMKDVMPPRPRGPMELTAFQTKAHTQSTTALAELGRKFDGASTGSDREGAHAVTYQVAYSTLVHNPAAVKHFCNVLGSVAVAGSVTMMPLDDFAVASDDAKTSAGTFVTVRAHVPV